MKMKWLVAGVVIVLAGVVVWRVRAPRAAAAPPLAPITEPVVFANINPYLAMFSFVRSSLAKYPDVKKALDIPRDPDLPQICDRPAIVSIYRENSPPLWGVGTPNCLAALGLRPKTGCFDESLLCAAYQITQQKEFKKFYMVKLDQVAVRIDVVNYLRPFQATRKDLRKDWVEPGVHGLLLQDGPRLTFQPPFSYLIYSWETDDTRRTARLRRQLEDLGKSAGVGAERWWKYPIYRFQCLSMLQHRPDFVPLLVLRDAPQIKKFGSAEIGRAAIDAGRHLARTFDLRERHFRRLYNPVTQDKGGWFGYDIVDHAGVVYSLFKLYAASHREELVPAGQGAVELLVQHVEPPLLEPDLLAIQRRQMMPLGGSALFLLSATEMPERLRRRVGVDRINRLARFLVEMQEQDGRFYDFYWQRLFGYRARHADAAFAGETLFALARYFKINANYEWLQAARAAAAQQIAQFNKDHAVNVWTMLGLGALHDVDPDARYVDACLAMADRLLARQWGNPNFEKPPYPDYAGGFGPARPPETLTAAVNVEGLLVAHWLAYQTGRDPAPYADGVLSGTHYLLQNQYRRDNTYYVNRPEETRGAFRASLIDPVITMDLNQHAIMALTGAYDVATLRETGQPPKEFKAEGTKELEDRMEAGGKVEK
jgi:hypothetical protein